MGTRIVGRSHGFPYSRSLHAHNSCVNTVNFSSGDGRFLVSGGDDRWLCLWDFHQDDITAPSHSLRLAGPQGNIFCLQFSSSNKYLFSGGASGIVIKYDTASLGSQIQPFTDLSPNPIYDDSHDIIRAISCHPTQDEIFITACEDGRIKRFDTRQPNQLQFIQLNHEITGIQYHPLMDHLFITSDSEGNVLLWDARVAYSSNNTNNRADGVVQTYHTKLARLSEPHLGAPESSSVEFDRQGTKFAVTFLNYLPTIYSLNDPEPLAVLSAQTQPDGSPIPSGERTYANAATMKHGAFGGLGPNTPDTLYAAGSDDFRGYVWKIPSVQELEERREIFSATEWLSSNSEKIAFTAKYNGPKVLPVEISTPFCHLTGHESIINTVAFHPYFLHVVTAGVEKRIVLHSPTPSSPCTQNLERSPTRVRQLRLEDSLEDSETYTYGLVHSLLSEEIGERMTLSLFDHIIRENSDIDIFGGRPYDEDSDSDQDSDSGEEDSDSSMDS